MTPLQTTLIQITLEVNPRATAKEVEDLDRKLADIGIDSLEAMSVMLAVMERFDIKIPDSEVDNLTTLNRLADFVERELAKLGRET
jgi:acyl carrier protein